MSTSSPVGNRELRALSLTFWIGAAYDALFAFLMLFAPRLLERTFDLPLPEPIFPLRLVGVLLAILAATYVVIARAPSAYRELVAIAIVGRTAGCAVIAWSALERPELTGLWGPAAGDLAFAVAHFVTGRRLLLR